MSDRFYFRDGQVWDANKSLFHIHDAHEAAWAVTSLNTQASLTQEYMEVVHRLEQELATERQRADAAEAALELMKRQYKQSNKTFNALQAENKRLHDAIKNVHMNLRNNSGLSHQQLESQVEFGMTILGGLLDTTD